MVWSRLREKLCKRISILLACFVSGLFLTFSLASVSTAMSLGSRSALLSSISSPNKGLVERQISEGLEHYHHGDIREAIAIWQDVLSIINSPQVDPSVQEYPRLLQYLARGYRDIGDDAQQVNALDQLIDYYQETHQPHQLGRMQTEKASAYQRQGLFQQAETLLCEPSHLLSDISFQIESQDESQRDRADGYSRDDSKAIALATETWAANCHEQSAIALAMEAGDKAGALAAWGLLGTGYWHQGNYDKAIAVLSNALEQSQALPEQPYLAELLNSLGGTYASLGQQHYRYAQLAKQTGDRISQEQQLQQARFYDDSATSLFEASFEKSRAVGNPMGELHSLLNVIPIYRRSFWEQYLQFRTESFAEAKKILAQLPVSHERVELGVKLALVGSPSNDFQRDNSSMGFTCPNPNHRDQSSDPATTFDASISDDLAEPMRLLAELESMARQLGDRQILADILGYRGRFTDCLGNEQGALDLFYQAQLTSNQPEQQYQWAWQAGQLLAHQGQTNQALASYEQAVHSVAQIRSDLAGASRDIQLDLRDRIEQIYRELADLKLQQLERIENSPVALFQPSSSKSTVSAKPSDDSEQAILETVLQTVDGLRLTELQNYLGDDCELPLLEGPFNSSTLSASIVQQPKTAVFNTIILPDRVAVILTTFPSAHRKHYSLHWISLGKDDLTSFVNDFRFNLEKRSDLAQQFRPQSQQLYDWMIRPFESELTELEIDSLVFINDGILRSIPMAVLHDGNQFLTQSYNIRNTPSLALAPSTTMELSDANSVLAFGLTQSSTIDPLEGTTLFPAGPFTLPSQIPSFTRLGLGEGKTLNPLPAVQAELSAIQQLLPSSKVFFDTDFTRDRLQQELTSQPPQILHLATHARFGFDAQQTYLVTGEKTALSTVESPVPNPSQLPLPTYNETINLNDLYQLIKQTQRDTDGLDFLVLTACETAVGSDRDALGLAGIAVQAGVKSSLASLWQVDDQVTADLISQFYEGLAAGYNKSESLRLAQATWIQDHPSGRYSHPGYWAPFVLVGME